MQATNYPTLGLSDLAGGTLYLTGTPRSHGPLRCAPVMLLGREVHADVSHLPGNSAGTREVRPFSLRGIASAWQAARDVDMDGQIIGKLEETGLYVVRPLEPERLRITGAELLVLLEEWCFEAAARKFGRQQAETRRAELGGRWALGTEADIPECWGTYGLSWWCEIDGTFITWPEMRGALKICASAPERVTIIRQTGRMI